MDIDLFSDADGLNSIAPVWFQPEDSAFEAATQLRGTVWAFPPRAIAGEALTFLSDVTVAGSGKILLLLPEDTGAPWYRPHTLRAWRRVARWPAGADIFKCVGGGRVMPVQLPFLLLLKAS